MMPHSSVLLWIFIFDIVLGGILWMYPQPGILSSQACPKETSFKRNLVVVKYGNWQLLEVGCVVGMLGLRPVTTSEIIDSDGVCPGGE